jgi:hypothetical protein
MNTLTVTVKSIGFTVGSMGQQNVTVETENGETLKLQMWTDIKSPQWTKSGEKCIIRLLPDTKVGWGTGYMIISNRAEIIQKI